MYGSDLTKSNCSAVEDTCLNGEHYVRLYIIINTT